MLRSLTFLGSPADCMGDMLAWTTGPDDDAADGSPNFTAWVFPSALVVSRHDA